jgi:hypothetical protein
MKRHSKTFIVVKKGSASERADYKALYLQRTAFGKQIKVATIRAALRPRAA